MKFLHTMIKAYNIEKSLKFYTELMDMEIIKEKYAPDLKFTLYYLSDKEGYTQLEIVKEDEKPQHPYNVGETFGHLAFEVKDFDEFTKKLNNYGLDYVQKPFVLGKNGTRVAFINDPDGNSIELIQKGFKL